MQPPDARKLEQEGAAAAGARMRTPAAAAAGTGAALVAAPRAEVRSELAPAAALQAGLACLKASPAVSPALSPLLMPAWHGLAAGMKDFTLSMPDLCAGGAQSWASPGFGSPEGGGLAAPQGAPPGSLWPELCAGQQPWQGTGGPWQGFEGPWRGLGVPSPETPEGKAALGAGTASSARSGAAGARAGTEPATVFGSPGLPDMGARAPCARFGAAWVQVADDIGMHGANGRAAGVYSKDGTPKGLAWQRRHGRIGARHRLGQPAGDGPAASGVGPWQRRGVRCMTPCRCGQAHYRCT